MNYLSVCSGIEAATCAWHSLGWTPVAFSEIEKFPSAVLAHHYPSVPNLGDMTRFQEWPDDLAPDLIVGGTPCQSFSVAGLRKGLADPRGNLALVYLALADRYRPEWLVWENVPGVLSSNGGRDFGAFLGGLVQLGYGFAYRVLDAQYFGVAQRRRRVFVVANARDWRRAAAVLFERHSLSGHPAPRRETGEGIAPTLAARTRGGGGLGTDFDCDGGLIPETCGALAKFACAGCGEMIDPLWGWGEWCDYCGHEHAAPTPIPFDTTQITSAANYSRPKAGDPCHPLAAGAHAPAIAFGWQNSAAQGDDVREECSPTLDKSKTPAIAFQSSQSGVRLVDTHATLDANNGPRRHNGVVQGMAVRRLTPIECERLQGFPDDYTAIPWRTWQEVARKGASYEGLLLERGMTLRGPSVEDCPDSPRYKALGNSMAVPVMRWIGERIEAVAAQSELEAAA